jgi:rubrerythrin
MYADTQWFFMESTIITIRGIIMHTEEMIKEATEICDRINGLFEKLRHLINEPKRCPACGEISDGICPACMNDPRS